MVEVTLRFSPLSIEPDFAKGKMFPLVFGGKVSGNVTVTSSDPRGECVSYLANVTTKSTRSPLKGNIMALATNAKIAKPGSGVGAPTVRADEVESRSGRFHKDRSRLMLPKIEYHT